jgi:hypothetical protein
MGNHDHNILHAPNYKGQSTFSAAMGNLNHNIYMHLTTKIREIALHIDYNPHLDY